MVWDVLHALVVDRIAVVFVLMACADAPAHAQGLRDPFKEHPSQHSTVDLRDPFNEPHPSQHPANGLLDPFAERDSKTIARDRVGKERDARERLHDALERCEERRGR
jgi:hypothetical protein